MFTTLFVKTQVALENYKNDEQGVTAIEYGLIAAAIAGVVALGFGDADSGIAGALSGVFETIRLALGGAAPTPGG
ncbi:Flp family type IVb pilin [Vibrio sp. 99-70-13A1]|uniref:Flp family type IVb pilin n=1 Tax=Vibrio sp. 99-70-13A1 TaxID=2607601 RepID=UPI001493D931|nr:Flp family type IVb pilin [Vibrio sp. 99-70-13A1]NOH98618.1 Flp family type IVb pilin [Vibrio sp. 99-70-13A1]